MGSKTRARELMKEAGVPIVPGTTDPVDTVDDARKIIDDSIGYPVAIKAAGGGGGKGFRVALSEDELEKAFEGAAREGEKFFSDATVYIERYLPDPRHVEVQVLADEHGNVIHLGERDCSVQRRHQKLIEESPAPAVDEKLRERIGKIGTEAAKAVGYRSAGHDRGPAPGRRVLLPRDEHPRAGRALRDRDGHRHRHRQGADQDRRGREAVDRPGRRALLRPRDRVPHQRRGRVEELRARARDDHRPTASPPAPACAWTPGVEAGLEISPMYDPMVAKLIVWDIDREPATRRAQRALKEMEVGGVKTLIPFHIGLLGTEQWGKGETCRDLIEDKEWLKQFAFEKPPEARRGRGGRGEGRALLRRRGLGPQVRRQGDRRGPRRRRCRQRRGPAPRRRPSAASAPAAVAVAAGDTLASPLQGSILKVAVEKGADVEEGALICVIEAMKMENEITAHKAGTVEELNVSEGGSISTGDTIAVIK